MAIDQSRSVPIRCFIVALTAAVILYLVLGALLVLANRQSRELRERVLLFDQAVHDIHLHTAAMASQSLLAAATGEQVFAARQAEHLAQVRNGLDRLQALHDAPVENTILPILERAFAQVRQTQAKALELAAAGQEEQAWTVLRGIAYETAQNRFEAELDRLDADIESRADATLDQQRRYADIAIWCIAAFTPLLVLVSLMLLRTARRHIRAVDTAQQALRENARTMEAVLDAATDRVILFDRSGRILSVNKACARGLGLTARDIVGKTLPEVFPSSIAANRLDSLHQAMDSDRVLRFSDERDGIVFDHIVTPLPDASGLPQGAALFARDITEIVRARETAEAANRTKSEFLANMSHEIRTPLNGILGMVQVLAGSNLDENDRQCLADIETASGALLALISDIIELSRLESGQVEPDRLPFVTSTILQALEARFGPTARDKGLALTTTMAPDVPQLVLGDGDRLRQALEYLVDNAVKFTNAGDIVVSVRRDWGMAAPGLRNPAVALLFSVRDTGIGIAAADQERIFERFAQADGSATRRYGGTGLGLAIANRLVQLLGGTIHLDSAPGRGSDFSFSLWFDLERMGGAEVR